MKFIAVSNIYSHNIAHNFEKCQNVIREHCLFVLREHVITETTNEDNGE